MRAPVWLALKGAEEDFVTQLFILVKQDLKIHKNKLSEYLECSAAALTKMQFSVFLTRLHGEKILI